MTGGGSLRFLSTLSQSKTIGQDVTRWTGMEQRRLRARKVVDCSCLTGKES